MKPDKQRIAIAEACGWKRDHINTAYNEKTQIWSRKGERNTAHLPDYLNDLNAMHEMEKMMTGTQLRAYDKLLETKGFETVHESYGWHTTAAQRSEAFLRTLGLWEDSPTAQPPTNKQPSTTNL